MQTSKKTRGLRFSSRGNPLPLPQISRYLTAPSKCNPKNSGTCDGGVPWLDVFWIQQRFHPWGYFQHQSLDIYDTQVSITPLETTRNPSSPALIFRKEMTTQTRQMRSSSELDSQVKSWEEAVEARISCTHSDSSLDSFIDHLDIVK